jgi:hypothetical protein
LNFRHNGDGTVNIARGKVNEGWEEGKRKISTCGKEIENPVASTTGHVRRETAKSNKQ